MPVAVLTLVKLGLLLLLYLFLARAIRVVTIDLYGPRRSTVAAAPRQPVAVAQPPRRPRKVPRELVVHVPDGKPRVVGLNRQRILIGRAHHADVIVDDPYMSDEHAEVAPDDVGWVVRDLGSTNGTFLNGAKVTQPTPLAVGDQVRLGKTAVELRR